MKAPDQYRSYSGSSCGNWSSWTDMSVESANGMDVYGIGVFEVNGPTNGTKKYQFRIRAVSRRYSAPSEPAEATPQAKPIAPTGLVVNSADRSVILHWDYPVNDNITVYQFKRRLKGASTWDAWRVIPKAILKPRCTR